MSEKKGPWIQIFDQCQYCGGTGMVPNNAPVLKTSAAPEEVECDECKGSGKSETLRLITIDELRNLLNH
jgi:DnaJ-class molecular chaperone